MCCATSWSSLPFVAEVAASDGTSQSSPTQPAAHSSQLSPAQPSMQPWTPDAVSPRGTCAAAGCCCRQEPQHAKISRRTLHIGRARGQPTAVNTKRGPPRAGATAEGLLREVSTLPLHRARLSSDEVKCTVRLSVVSSDSTA